MKIGIIVYSYTGNTLSVAEKIQLELVKKGHIAALERVRAADENPNNRTPVSLIASPDPAPYDQLILAAPTNGFSLAQVMKTYLKERPQLAGKPVRLLVTHHFPKAWLGGNQTINQFKSAVEANGGKVGLTGVINWSSKKRDSDITALVDRFSQY